MITIKPLFIVTKESRTNFVIVHMNCILQTKCFKVKGKQRQKKKIQKICTHICTN